MKKSIYINIILICVIFLNACAAPKFFSAPVFVSPMEMTVNDNFFSKPVSDPLNTVNAVNEVAEKTEEEIVVFQIIEEDIEENVVLADKSNKEKEGYEESLEESVKEPEVRRIVVEKGMGIQDVLDLGVPASVLEGYVHFVKSSNLDEFNDGVKVGAAYLLAGQVIEYAI